MSDKSRTAILEKIKSSLRNSKIPIPFPEINNDNSDFEKDTSSAAEKFAIEFNALGGKFIYCENEIDLVEKMLQLADTMNWKSIQTHDQFIKQLFEEKNADIIQQKTDLHTIEVGLSGCECLVARTGSVLLSSSQPSGRSLPVYAPIHIVVAFTHQVVYDIEDSILFIQKKYKNNLPSMICLSSGPSRTADIEKTLVVGVHGPKEVYVFLVDSDWKK